MEALKEDGWPKVNNQTSENSHATGIGHFGFFGMCDLFANTFTRTGVSWVAN